MRPGAGRFSFGQPDYPRAARLYMEATQGFHEAYLRLGDMLARWEGFPQSKPLAERLYRLVLEHEERLMEDYGFYSAAYESARAALAMLHRLPDMKQEEPLRQEQRELLNELIELLGIGIELNAKEEAED